MRILQAMAGAEFGGAEAFFVRLACAFQRAGLKQKVLIRDHPDRLRQLTDQGCDVMQLPFGGRFDFKTKRAFKSVVQDFKPDVVMTWMNRATDFCPTATDKMPFVHVARLGGYYDLKYYRNCDHLVGNTRDIVDYLQGQNWDKDKAHYLPNFVDADHGAQPLSRKDFYTPKDVPLIVAMGRLHENKAFDTLFQALSRVPDAYLWLAGEGPLREDLESLAEKLAIKPRVRFLGWMGDIQPLLKAADVFVCPSRHEPLGNVVIEAWALGVPVVATDSLGPGMLIEHMETGMLSPVDDARALAECIRYVLQNPDLAEKISAQGLQAYRENFTEQIVVGQYKDFFDKVTA